MTSGNMHGQPSAGKSRVDGTESLSGEGSENVVDKLVSICNWGQIDWADTGIILGKTNVLAKSRQAARCTVASLHLPSGHVAARQVHNPRARLNRRRIWVGSSQLAQRFIHRGQPTHMSSSRFTIHFFSSDASSSSKSIPPVRGD
jgi:hypothetical protein